MEALRLNKPSFLLLLSLINAGLFAQDSREFTAIQAVDYASKNSVQVKNALISTSIQKQVNREITAAAYPQVNGTGAFTNYLSIPTNLLPGEFFGQPGTYIPVKFGTKFNASYGLNLQQILFDGQVFVGLQARSAAILLSDQARELTEEQIKANVYKIYYQLVAGRNQVKVLDANILRSEELLRVTNALYTNGFQEKLDVDRLNVALSNLRTEKMKVENQLQTGYLGLKYLMGMPVNEQIVLTDSLRDQDLKEGLLVSDSFKYDDRIEYRLQQTTAKLNEYNIRRYRMSYIPTLSLNAGYSGNAQRNKFNFFDGSQPWFRTSYFGLNLSVPIFDGFAKSARIQNAKLQLQQTQNNIANLENSINNDVQTAKVQISNALVTLDAQKKNITLAQQVYNQTRKKYEQGVGSNVEITNAETELITAQNNYFSAMYDAIIARIDYLKAVGKL
jgi:outer membrane protein TolC